MYVRSTKLDNTSLSFMDGPALSSSVACRLVLTKLLSANGDGEIRTLDPLLARQVLSQLSYTPIGCGSSFLFSKSNPCIHLFEFLNSNGLKWTRTTDLTLIRRAL